MPAGGSWKTTSGLLDDFDFDIEEAWFGTNEKFGDTLLLNLRGTASQEGEVVDEEHTLLFACGDGWQAGKGGQIATHPTGKVNFNSQSNIGKLINAVVELGDDVIQELSTRGETYEASTWQGLRFHIERKKYSFVDRNTKETREYEVPLPTDFLGVVEDEAAPKKATRKPAAKPTAAKKPPLKKPAPRARKIVKEEEGGDDLRDAVVAFASDYEDHAEFVEAVFDEEVFDRAPEVHNDEELTNDILDEDGEVWQMSRG